MASTSAVQPAWFCTHKSIRGSCTKISTHAAWPWYMARMRGVLPNQSSALGSMPGAASRSRTHSSRPIEAAHTIGATPPAATRIPGTANSRRIHAAWPPRTACASAVYPLLSSQFTSALAPRSSSTHSRRPRRAASMSGVNPPGPAASTSIPGTPRRYARRYSWP